MSYEVQYANPALNGTSRWTRRFLWSMLCAVGLSGCAAFSPIEGVPASHLAPEFLGQSRNHQTTISPMLLTRSRPQQYLIDSGDVLSVYIPGVLGTRSPDFQAVGEAPPINIAYDPEVAPSVGYPIHVRDDGTMSLPQVEPIYVAGMTLRQVEESIQRAYSHPKQIIPAGNERILVSLFRPREIRVLVVRQESSTSGGGLGTPQPGQLNIGATQKGTARVVSLKAYENDVMHALSRLQGVDGLPGLDAENMIRVIRGRSSRTSPSAGDGYGPGPSGTSGPLYQDQPSSDPRFHQPAPGATYQSLPLQPTHEDRGVSPEYVPPQVHGAPYGAQQGTVMRYQSPDSNWTSPFHRGNEGRNVASNSRPASGHSVTSTNPISSGYRSGTVATPYDRNASLAGTSLPYSNPRPSSIGASTPTNPYTSNRSGSGHSITNGMAKSPFDSSYRQGNDVQPQFANNSSMPFEPQGFAPQSTLQPSNGLPANRQQNRAATSQQSLAQSAWSGVQPGSRGSIETTIPTAPGARLNRVQYLAPVGSAGSSPMLAPPAWNGAQNLESQHWGEESWQSAPHGELNDAIIGGIEATIDGPNVIKIPVRLGQGESLNLTEADITLHDGDIVFIESRGSEVFYTGGLLGGGQYTLPRDYDLRVLDALSIAQSGGSRGSSRSLGGVSALNQDVTVSASKVIVLRTLVDGSRLPIEVDLRRIKRNMTSRENILMQPGDHLILQYSKVEAIGAFFERHLLEGALFGLAASQVTSN